jgi:acid stress-induced BolA-like protein IbaG/YrbA
MQLGSRPLTSSPGASARRSAPAARPAAHLFAAGAARPRVQPQRGSPAPVRSIPVSGPGSAPAAPQSAEGGVISEVLMATMKQKIGEALETDQVTVVDAYGDGRHVSIDVVSKLFEGKGAVARQRLVYKVRAVGAVGAAAGPRARAAAADPAAPALGCWPAQPCSEPPGCELTPNGHPTGRRPRLQAIWYELANAVHAVDALTTKTPEEVAK